MELARDFPTTVTEHLLRDAWMAACRPAGPHPMMRTSVSILQPVDVLDDVFLGPESHEGIDEDLVLEDEECRDGVDVEPEFGPDRPGDIKHSNADISKAKRLLGYDPQWSFERGIEAAIEWYKENL